MFHPSGTPAFQQRAAGGHLELRQGTQVKRSPEGFEAMVKRWLKDGEMMI